VPDELVKQKYESTEEIFEMNNGCICCTVRGDLVRILNKILGRTTRTLDAIIIETTGLADPAPVAQTFFMDESIKARARLDAIITVVDARHCLPKLREERPAEVEVEAIEQVAFADKILLNKIDLVSEKDLEEVEAELRKTNKMATIVRTEQCNVDISTIINVGAFDLDTVLKMDPGRSGVWGVGECVVVLAVE
jgi:G3E family GTPase